MAIVLTTLAAVKQQLGITVTTYDSELTTIIEQAEDWILRRCNLNPAMFDVGGSVTEYFDGNQADRIVLTYVPVSDTPVVKLLGYGSDELTISSDLYTYDPMSGVLAFKSNEIGRWLNGLGLGFGAGFQEYLNPSRLPGLNFGYGFRNVKVTYTGNEYAGGLIPPALARAAQEMSVWMYRAKRDDPSIQSEKLGDYQYSRGLDGFQTMFTYIENTWLSTFIRAKVGL